METKIVFKAMCNGKIVHKTIPIQHPEFKILPSEIFLGFKLPPQSISSQVIDYLDGVDKSDIMEKHGFDIILDYYPQKPRVRKKKVDEIADFIKYMTPVVELHPELQRPIEAVMSEAKGELFGRGKSNQDKAMEVMKMVEISLKAATGAYVSITKMLKGINESVCVESDRELLNGL